MHETAFLYESADFLDSLSWNINLFVVNTIVNGKHRLLGMLSYSQNILPGANKC